MIQNIKPEERHFSDFGWLKTYWLFSFSSYFDSSNIQFGALRVFNDDVVAAGTGFRLILMRRWKLSQSRKGAGTNRY